MALTDKWCFTPRLNDLWLWGWTPGKERLLPPFVLTPSFSTRINPGKLVFQHASGSPDQASLDPHFEDIVNRPVHGPSTFDHSKVFGEGLY